MSCTAGARAPWLGPPLDVGVGRNNGTAWHLFPVGLWFEACSLLYTQGGSNTDCLCRLPVTCVSASHFLYWRGQRGGEGALALLNSLTLRHPLLPGLWWLGGQKTLWREQAPGKLCCVGTFQSTHTHTLTHIDTNIGTNTHNILVQTGQQFPPKGHQASEWKIGRASCRERV